MAGDSRGFADYWCGKQQVIDKCVGCPAGGLDLWAPAFEVLAPLGTGVIQASWELLVAEGGSSFGVYISCLCFGLLDGSLIIRSC